MINQEKVELWGVGCQSPPDTWFSHLNFGYLSKNELTDFYADGGIHLHF